MNARVAIILALVACHHSSLPLGADAQIDAANADAIVGTTVATSRQLCKLLSNRNTSDPTANDVQHRANMLGADLGISVVYDDAFYILFGDTIGYAGIWPPQESHPDAIGYAADGASAIAFDPSLLCSDLQIFHLPANQSVGPHVDPTVAADFAASPMTAPSGGSLGQFIHNPAGSTGTMLFPYLPGDFEVPSGAFAYGDSIYVFYTTVVSPSQPDMVASYLVRWTQPSATTPPSYQILYAIDERVDANGPLHGHFINIAAQVAGDQLYIFGTGAYRSSEVYVARKPLAALATPGGFEELGSIISTPGYGEISVRYFADIQRWVLLAEESLPASNRIVAHAAASPTGPWTSYVMLDMADPDFRSEYCCTVDDQCANAQMFNCERTGFYGSYLFPSLAFDGAIPIVTYTLSSFSPYNVALFQTTLPDQLLGR